MTTNETHGTVVNSNDLKTCPSWVQALNGPVTRDMEDWLSCYGEINKSLKTKPIRVVQTGLDLTDKDKDGCAKDEEEEEEELSVCISSHKPLESLYIPVWLRRTLRQ